MKVVKVGQQETLEQTSDFKKKDLNIDEKIKLHEHYVRLGVFVYLAIFLTFYYLSAFVLVLLHCAQIFILPWYILSSIVTSFLFIRFIARQTFNYLFPADRRRLIGWKRNSDKKEQ